MKLTSQPISHPLQGEIYIPGDKSISHRAILFNSIAQGTATLTHTLLGKDNLATIDAMRALGVSIEITDKAKGIVNIQGVGLHGLKKPTTVLDMGNSGTGMRLLTGILAGQAFDSVIVGDESLQHRPMRRIIEPLRMMGAKINGRENQYAPLHLQATSLQSISYFLPMASAQVKSCLLLAGLYAQGKTVITEPEASRDHTERMLSMLGADIEKNHLTTSISGQNELSAMNLDIPGDISSAAFFMVAATLIPGSHIILKHIGVNPTRTGIVDILRAMGADISILNIQQENEPYADIEVRYAPLHGIDIPSGAIVSAIDEFPIIFIAAANASGTTRLENAEELTVKESNRLLGMFEGLRKLGINCHLLPAGIEIIGSKMQGGFIDTYGDHRIAMSFLIAGAASQQPITINQAEMIDTSFPNFLSLTQMLRMNINP